MSDITLLGVIAAGLGVYCLYLQWRINMLNRAGQFTAALLVEAIQHYTSMSERDAALEAHRMALAKVKA
jgi:hypothetical protein